MTASSRSTTSLSLVANLFSGLTGKSLQFYFITPRLSSGDLAQPLEKFIRNFCCPLSLEGEVMSPQLLKLRPVGILLEQALASSKIPFLLFSSPQDVLSAPEIYNLGRTLNEKQIMFLGFLAAQPGNTFLLKLDLYAAARARALPELRYTREGTAK